MATTSTWTAAPPRAWQATLVDLVSLTKPRIIELLLITTVPAMVLAAGGWPGSTLLLATVAGGAMVSGSAHATNMVIDRDIDAAMHRTEHRPLPAGRLTPPVAITFAAVLLVVGSLTVLVGAGWLPAALTVGAWLWYVVIYTLLLKRRSVQNIVIGGVAGAAPPMIGWAAVTGRVEPAALVLFTVVVMWTPIHFWALAIGTGQDYARAGVPMLPVVRGPRVAAVHGAAYALATVLASLALPLTGFGGPVYLVLAGLLGVGLLVVTAGLVRNPVPKTAWRTFHASNAYLASLFVVVGVAGLIG
jgi:heme o synthase